MKLIVSPSNDPFFNLACEEYLLKNQIGEENFVFMYVNTDSVIIGRNQNPWQEANLSFLTNRNIPVARRISGGGTVYHDLGNVNISFVTNKNEKNFNNYKQFTKPVISFLKIIGVEAELNKRNDIVAGDLKLSGNAQFSSKNRLLSHGTLLVSSNLEILRESLDVKSVEFISKSTQSTRSSVASLNGLLGSKLKIEDVITGILNQFRSEYNTEDYELKQHERNQIIELSQKFRSFEWIFARTQDFQVFDYRKNLQVFVSGGMIKSITSPGMPEITDIETRDIKFLPESINKSDLPDNIKSGLIKTFF